MTRLHRVLAALMVLALLMGGIPVSAQEAPALFTQIEEEFIPGEMQEETESGETEMQEAQLLQVFAEEPANEAEIELEQEDASAQQQGVVLQSAAAQNVPETPDSSFKSSLKKGVRTITGFKGKETQIAVPALIKEAPVTAIAAKAFYNCKNITYLRLPEGVKSIGSRAFYKCKALAEIVVPASVTSIASDAFKGCENFVLVVDENSWAYNWCIEKGMAFELSGTVLDAPAALALNAGEITLGVGEKFTLTAEDDKGSTEGFSFKSSKTGTVSVNKSGVITAKKAGKATITVRTANYVKAECKVVVKPAPKKVTLSEKKMTLYMGQSALLGWKLSSGAAGKVSFKSDSDCVSVDANGMLTANAIGKAKITVKSYNGKKASCTVTVLDVPASVALDRESVSLPMQTSVQLKPIIDENCATTFTYASDDASIAAVDANGLITGVNAGSTVVRVFTHNGHSASCAVNVTPAPTKVFLDAAEITLGVKEKITLTAVDDMGNAEGFTFKSSKPKVASVNAEGVISAKKAGKTRITVSAFNGVSAECLVIVKAAPKKVTLSEKKMTLYLGQSALLGWKLNSGASGSVSFSSDSDCVSVDANGMVTANAIGKAKVTVKTYNGKKAGCTVTVVGVPSYVALEQENVSLPMQATAQLKPIIDAGCATTFTYASDDASIAAVDANGVITGVNVGSTVVRVTTHNGCSAQCAVEVTLAPTKISLDAAEITLGVKEKITLKAVDDLGNAEGFTFKSSKPKVASVSAEGEIKAKKAGKTRITVSAFNGVSAECLVIVKAAPASVKFTEKKISLLTGQKYQLKWKLSSKSAGKVSFKSDSDCVSVDENGVVTAISEGKAKITVTTYNGKKASCTVASKPTYYAITSVRTGGGNIYATVSTREACTLHAQVLSEDGENVIFQASAPAGEHLQMQEIAVAAPQSFPDFYVIRAELRDEKGNLLCNPYISRKYTSAYVQIEQDSPENYAPERVLDFGGAGFGVLADSVIVIPGAADVNGDEYSFDTDREIQPGDVLLLNGTPVKVAEVLSGGGGGGRGRARIRRDRNITVQEAYDSINVSGYMDLGDAYKNGAKAKLREIGEDEAAVEVFKIKTDIPVGDAITVSPEFGGTARIRLLYDKKKLGKDYFETEYCVEMGGKVDVFLGASVEKNETIELMDLPLPIGATGLSMDLELNIPLKFSAKAGGTATFSFSMKKGVAYTPDMGKQEINEEPKPTAEFKLNGEFTASVGVGVSGGITFLDDSLRVALNGETGLQGKGEWTPVTTADSMNAAKTSFHACKQCLDITLSVYGDFFISLNGRFNEEGEDREITRFTIVRGEIPVLEYYYSLVNEALSVHGGNRAHGWGDCPNNKYRCTVYTVDEYGEDITGIAVSVTRPGMAALSGNSTWQDYLYPGSYLVSGDFDGYTVSDAFDVSNVPSGTTLNAPACSLSGHARDAITQKGISGVSVTIKLADGKILKTTTDEEGFYNFRNLKAGNCSVYFTAKGYTDRSAENLKFAPNTVNQLNVDMMGPMPILEASVTGGGSQQALPEDGVAVDGIPKIVLTNVADRWGTIEEIYVSHEDCSEVYEFEMVAYAYSTHLTCLDMGDGQYTMILTGYISGTMGGSETVVLQVKGGRMTVVKDFSISGFSDDLRAEGKFSSDTKFSGTLYPTKTKFTAKADASSATENRKGKSIWTNGTGYLNYEKNDNGYYDLIFVGNNRCLYNVDVVGHYYTRYELQDGSLMITEQWYKGTADK